MEANRLRRGMKAKPGMFFHRAAKPSSIPYSSKVKPPPSSSMASLSFVAEEKIGFIQNTLLNKKASMMAKMEGGDRAGNQISSFGGGGGGGGNLSREVESVDSRAATYISYVQERFRMEEMEYD
ncbi:hypothetical protein KFK09_012048 [Dendrobium nobile]|uniref:Uncharacterized protein n=1 Tax=Dendrobium nobile TaxID=94219 RepID=A0A8T3BJT0_DENNO|nr:hypothetical protein KFK09_012048 [Dendrobium nobile]